MVLHQNVKLKKQYQQMMLASQKAQFANELKIIDEYERATHI
jgi:hypothetical protein